MLFGSTWTKSRSRSQAEDSVGKETQPPKQTTTTSEEEWLDLKEDEHVGKDVATISKPSTLDPSFEVVGCEEEKEDKQLQVPKDTLQVRPRPEQVLEAMERMLAKNSGRMTREKWRAILVLLLCSVMAKQTLFYGSKEHEEFELPVPVPAVLMEGKPSPAFEAFVMMPPQQRHYGEEPTKPVAVPHIGITVQQHAHQPYRSGYLHEEERVRIHLDGNVAEPPKERPNTRVGTETIRMSTKSHRPAKPVAAAPNHEFSGMKACSDTAKNNQTDAFSPTAESSATGGATTFVDPRPRPSPSHEGLDATSPNEDIIRSLSKRIAELQNKNGEYMERLTRMAIETSRWRSRAVLCDQEVEQLQTAQQELMAKYERATATTTTKAAPMIPIPTMLNDAWNHYSKHSKKPMWADAGVPQSDNMWNVSIPHVENTALEPEERPLRPVRTTTLIPSPA